MFRGTATNGTGIATLRGRSPITTGDGRLSCGEGQASHRTRRLRSAAPSAGHAILSGRLVTRPTKTTAAAG